MYLYMRSTELERTLQTSFKNHPIPQIQVNPGQWKLSLFWKLPYFLRKSCTLWHKDPRCPHPSTSYCLSLWPVCSKPGTKGYLQFLYSKLIHHLSGLSHTDLLYFFLSKMSFLHFTFGLNCPRWAHLHFVYPEQADLLANSILTHSHPPRAQQNQVLSPLCLVLTHLLVTLTTS